MTIKTMIFTLKIRLRFVFTEIIFFKTFQYFFKKAKKRPFLNLNGNLHHQSRMKDVVAVWINTFISSAIMPETNGFDFLILLQLNWHHLEKLKSFSVVIWTLKFYHIHLSQEMNQTIWGKFIFVFELIFFFDF